MHRRDEGHPTVLVSPLVPGLCVTAVLQGTSQTVHPKSRSLFFVGGTRAGLKSGAVFDTCSFLLLTCNETLWAY